jgi:hypothetical protein
MAPLNRFDRYAPATVMVPRIKCRFCDKTYLQQTAYATHLYDYHCRWTRTYFPDQIPHVGNRTQAEYIARDDFAAEWERREALRNRMNTYAAYDINQTAAVLTEGSHSVMATQESLEATLEYHERKAEEAAERLAWLESMPQDDEFEDGSVITFKKQFHDGVNARLYTYAAVKYDGVWSTTGPRSPKGIHWEDLLTFITSGVEEVWFATEWERII